MTNKETLKKKIIYRSNHRGSKEMDILLGSFVKKYINILNDNDLNDLEKILFLEDEIIYSWYFNKKNYDSIPNTNVSNKLRNFKI